MAGLISETKKRWSEIDHIFPSSTHATRHKKNVPAFGDEFEDNLIYACNDHSKLPAPLNIYPTPLKLFTQDPKAFYEKYRYVSEFLVKCIIRQREENDKQYRAYLDAIEILASRINKQVHFSELFCSSASSYLPLTNAAKSRVKEIQKKLQHLRSRLKKDFSTQLLASIKSLTRELHTLMANSLKEQKRKLKSLRKQHFGQAKIQLPKMISTPALFIPFKLFDDFSGCEEESIGAVSKTINDISYWSLQALKIIAAIKSLNL
jgi:hypothetical protein